MGVLCWVPRRLTVGLVVEHRLFRHGWVAPMAVTLLLPLRGQAQDRTASHPWMVPRRRCRRTAHLFPRRRTRNASPVLATTSRDSPVLAAAIGPTWAAPSQGTPQHLRAVRAKPPNVWAPLAEPARGSSVFWLTHKRAACARRCARWTWNRWLVVRSPKSSWGWPTTSVRARAPSLKVSPARHTLKPSLNWQAKGSPI